MAYWWGHRECVCVLCVCVFALGYWVFSVLVYPHRRWNICCAPDKYGQSMGDVCTHKYLLSVCLFVRHFESCGLDEHYVEYLFGNDFAFALNLWRYCFLEEKKYDCWAGRDLEQEIGQRWKTGQKTATAASLECGGANRLTLHTLMHRQRKYLIHQRELPAMLSGRTSFNCVTRRRIYKHLFTCTEVRRGWWTQSCWSLWDHQILHVPVTLKTDGGKQCWSGNQAVLNMPSHRSIFVITLYDRNP